MWTGGERRLLDDLAHGAGGAAQAVRLTRELQRARERSVLARALPGTISQKCGNYPLSPGKDTALGWS